MRSVSCSLVADVLAPATLELQVAVATKPAREHLSVRLDGAEVPVRELAVVDGDLPADDLDMLVPLR